MADGVTNKDTNDSLLMKSWDWERFNDVFAPGNCYSYFIRSMGDVKGKRILDSGCGDGWLSVILAKRGAEVHGFDLSPEFIRTAQRRAQINEVEDKVVFETKSFDSIDYSDDYFDLVVGSAILHHVKIEDVLNPLRKVLKKNGKAIFMECFGNSKWLERFRLLVPVPVDDSDKSHWGQQLKYADIQKFHAGFQRVNWREFELFSRLDRIMANQTFVSFLNRFDEALFRLIPALRRYARLIVLQLEEPRK